MPFGIGRSVRSKRFSACLAVLLSYPKTPTIVKGASVSPLLCGYDVSGVVRLARGVSWVVRLALPGDTSPRDISRPGRHSSLNSCSPPLQKGGALSSPPELRGPPLAFPGVASGNEGGLGGIPGVRGDLALFHPLRKLPTFICSNLLTKW